MPTNFPENLGFQISPVLKLNKIIYIMIYLYFYDYYELTLFVYYKTIIITTAKFDGGLIQTPPEKPNFSA